MAFTLVQAGASLYTLNAQGGASAALSVPTDITLATNRVPRFAKFNRYIIVVNTPSRPITVDAGGTVRPLTPIAPSAQTVLTTIAGGSLTGTYLAKQTYFIKDAQGNLIAESDFGPVMTVPLSITTDFLHAAFPNSSEAYFLATMPLGSTYGSRLYRTVTDGAVYFKWLDVDGNTAGFVEDDTADASISIFAAPLLGPVPDLTLICEWQGRLWGVDRVQVDDLRYTEAGSMSAWSLLNTIPIQHVGADAAGCMALAPRRNALGVARRDTFMQVTGTSTSNFVAVVVPGGEGRGVCSQESVVMDNDIAYFLWNDGVYIWDSSGITSICDNSVSGWFDSDTYFNRSQFYRATAQLVGRRYRLFLASAGSTNLDRWVEYDIESKTWWGIHKSDAFTPSCTVKVAGADNMPYPMVGSQEGYVLQEHDEANDMDAVGIPVRIVTKAHSGGDPELDKYFGELSVWGKGQATGSVTITPSVGTLDGQVELAAFDYDMTKGRHRVGRVGAGQHATLTLEHDTIDEPVVLYGYTIKPVHVIGRR